MTPEISEALYAAACADNPNLTKTFGESTPHSTAHVQQIIIRFLDELPDHMSIREILDAIRE